MSTEVPKTSNELAVERTDLAVDRTVMAADRSLMAWIRTALSMISFGFTIYKVLEGFQKVEGAVHHENSPRNVGLFLIGLGTLSMIMGTIEYWARIKEMRQLQPLALWRPSFIIAVIMSVTGLFLFLSIIVRVF